MALFLSLHQAPGLSPEEIAGYAPDVAKSVHATFRQLYVNTATGFIVSLYEADSPAAVEQEFERVGFPFDSINELDYTLSAAELAAMLSVADEPRLDRPVTLALRGDWGQANMHRICGWLAQEIGDRSPHGSQFAIWSGRGGTDQIAALRSGAADIAVVTPTAAVSLLQPGDLCALGVIGQRDRLVVAVDAALPATTVADLASVPGGVTVATSPDDGVNLIGLAVHKALRLAGLDTAALSFRYDERPFPAIGWFTDGEADVLIHEAIMTPHWQRIAAKRPVRYLPWGDDVLAAFAAEGWPSATVEAGYLPGLTSDLLTLDFSDFVLLCPRTLADDVAYLAAWCMVKTRRALEAQYAHLPQDHSPVTYPLVPADMARTPVPLHPAAARAYADLDDDPVAGPAIWS